MNCLLNDSLCVCVLKSDMAFWSIDGKSSGSLNDIHSDMTRQLNISTRDAKNDDTLPSPSTPLRQRRLPASFWQEPNVPRRPVRVSSWRSTRRVDTSGRITPQVSLLHQRSPHDRYQPVELLDRRRSAAELAFSTTWTGTDRNWKDTSEFNFDVPTSAASVDFVRHFAHLSPWALVGARLPVYPLLASDYGRDSCCLSDELAASAAVMATYLRWRAAAEEGCNPVAKSAPTSPPVASDWPSMMWRPHPTPATASVAVQRFHRYHPY